MKDRVLVIGGAGFIGSHLVYRLQQLGYEITVFDNLSEQIHGPQATNPFVKSDEISFYLGDVRSKAELTNAMKNQDMVIHLAAETGTGQSMYQIAKYMDVNCTGTANILDVIVNQKLDVKKFIIASSRALYGEGKYECHEHGIIYPGSRCIVNLARGDFNIRCPYCQEEANLLPTDESSEIRPESIYALTKYSQEQMALLVGNTIGMPVTALRFQNVYGPGQSLINPYTGILSIFSTRILNKSPINIFEDGLESRDFVYIDDVVNSILLALQSNQMTNDIFNVGSGASVSVGYVVEQLKKAFQSDVDVIISGNYRLGDIRHNFADISKIHNQLGFVPSIPFTEGLSRFVEWVLTQHVSVDGYDKSMEELQAVGLLR